MVSLLTLYASKFKFKPRFALGFERFLESILFLRFAVLAVSAFLPLSFPDVWRQVVSLGVSMRYWSRWAVESDAHHLLLPAVLDSQGTQGIMPMEFPLIYWITAPWFSLGPHLGRGFAILMNAFLVYGLVWVNARIWKGKKVCGVDPYPAMLLIPIFSIGLQWSGKYMPDFLSVLLILLAIGLSWSKDRLLSSFWVSCVGLLLKPTSVIVFLVLLAHPKNVRKWLKSAIWIIPSVMVSYFYYTKGIQAIAQFQEIPSAVGVQGRSFQHGLIEFFHHIPFVLKFYFERAFFLSGILLVLGISIWKTITQKAPFPILLWAISLLQFIAITTLDGGNLFYDHYYYLIGLGPVLCLLFVDAFQKCENPFIRTVLVLGILVPLAEISLMDLKTLYKSPKDPMWTIDQQVRELRARNPDFPWRKGYVFYTAFEPAPMLGLYFGEIQGASKAKYGLFYSDQTIPGECSVVDESPMLRIAKCH